MPIRDDEKFVQRLRVDDAECWIWTGPLTPQGYGYLRRGSRPGKLWLAHRYSYTLALGEIPTGLVVDHLCRVRSCCNPDHLEAVTQAENMKRAGPYMPNATKTHCPQGHPYDETNTRWYDGRRYCTPCKHLQSLAQSAKRREARAAKLQANDSRVCARCAELPLLAGRAPSGPCNRHGDDGS